MRRPSEKGKTVARELRKPCSRLGVRPGFRNLEAKPGPSCPRRQGEVGLGTTREGGLRMSIERRRIRYVAFAIATATLGLSGVLGESCGGSDSAPATDGTAGNG